MKVSNYLRGQPVRLSAEVRNETGVLSDPATLTVSIKKPDGTTLTKAYPADAEVMRTGQGLYHLDFTTVLTGRHYVRWVSTLPNDAQEGQFIVSAGEFSA